jgi:glycosyltransferase involved in cell wall biosynthesis
VKISLLSYDFGEYSIRLASALSENAEVQLLLPEQLATPYLSRLSPAVRFQPFRKPRLRDVPGQLRTAFSLIRRIREFAPDVIHVQQGHMWFNLGLPLLARYPLVVTVHDPRHHLGDAGGQKVPQWVYDFGFRRATRLIVHGIEMQRVVVGELAVPAERIHVIPHVVLGDETAASGIQEEPGTILFFGRIWGYKGLDYLIRAEPRITSRIPSARIVIAGEGEDFSKYRSMMVNPDRFVVHNEFIPDSRIAELFGAASVVVLPYVEATQSGVIPLAYTFSRPVVATTVGSLPEMVDDGRTGLLVPPRNEEALAEAVVRLLKDDALRRQMGRNGKGKIDSEASAEVIARKMLEVYELAMGGRRGRSVSQTRR